MVVDLRNMAEKEGLIPLHYGHHSITRFYRDGRVVSEAASPTLAIEGIDSSQLMANLEFSISFLDQIVEEAHLRFGQPTEQRKYEGLLEFMRERADGSWEYFDLESLDVSW